GKFARSLVARTGVPPSTARVAALAPLRAAPGAGLAAFTTLAFLAGNAAAAKVVAAARNFLRPTVVFVLRIWLRSLESLGVVMEDLLLTDLRQPAAERTVGVPSASTRSTWGDLASAPSSS